MKNPALSLIVPVLFASTAVTAAPKTTYLCEAPSNQRPHDTFQIELSDGPDANSLYARANVQYIRHAFRGSEERSLPRPLPGCDVASYYRLSTTNELHVECQPDGDPGAFTMDLSDPRSISGSVKFWEEQMDYPAGTEFALTCRKI